mmetsp:Transcript_2529/g.7933  ORF Transcript_2529/g.7933 Transcript_2529/m.7933 type:complete len:559 (+) Transcript_2529:22-1698(+)
MPPTRALVREREVLVRVRLRAAAELGRRVAARRRGPQEPLVGEEAVDAHGPARVDAARRDAQLRAEAEAEAVGEARGRVVEDVRRVDEAQERVGDGRVLGDDALRVARRVRVDVGDGRGDVRYDVDAQGEAAVLPLLRLVGLGEDEAPRDGPGPAEERDALGDERVEHGLGEAATDAGLVEEHGLAGVAGRRVVRLGVDDDLDGRRRVRGRVDVDVADAVRVAEHGHLRRLLHVLHEVVGAPGHDQVHEGRRRLVRGLEEPRDGVAAREERHRGRERAFRASRRRGDDRVADHAVERRVRLLGLRPALEDQRAPGPERERGDLRQRLRPRLEDHQHHPKSGGPLLEHQTRRQLAAHVDLAQRVAHGRERRDARGRRRELRGAEAEALLQVRRDVRARRDVGLVGREDLRRARRQRERHALEDRRALRAGEALEAPRGRARGRGLLGGVRVEGRLPGDGRREVGPQILAAHEAPDDVLRRARRHDDALDAHLERPERRADLGLHAAAAALGHGPELDGGQRRRVDLADDLRAMRARRPVVEAVDVREEDEELRAEELRH